MIYETLIFSLQDTTKMNLYVADRGYKNWLIVTHGLGEHGLRHSHFFELFKEDYNICIYDLRGHGESEGERGNINNFFTYVEDLAAVLEHLKNKYKMSSYSLFGHSMGALVVATYMKKLVSKHFYPQKIFLSSPVVRGAGTGKIIALFSQGFHNTLASLPLTLKVKGMLNLKKLSHNPQIYKDYLNDKKNNLSISLHLFLQILAHAKSTFTEPLGLQCESFVSIGTGDVLVDERACIEYFQQTDKNAKLFIIKNGYHELHNEIPEYKEAYLKFLKNAFL